MRKQSRWLMLATIIGAAFAMLAFSACGGDDSTNSSATASGNSHATATHQPDSNATKTEQPTDNGGNGGGDLSDLQNLGQGVESATGKVAYTQSDTAADGTVDASTFTIYSKPPNSRWDSGDPSDPSSLTILIETSDTTYSCSAADETCVGFPSSGSSGAGLLAGLFSPAAIGAYVAAAEAAGVSVDKSDENIAGASASCFSWEDSSADATTVKGKICFNDAGLMVLLESEDSDGSKSSMRATEATGDVSDSDFEPPYPVTTIPGQ